MSSPPATEPAPASDAEPAAEPATIADTGRRVGEHRCRVVAHVAVNSDYRRLVLAAPAGALAAAAGQFFHLLCPAGPAGTPFLRRPMSVYRIEPEAGRVQFLYKVHGEGTRALATLVPGDVFEILGPLGRGFRLEPHWRHALLVGRGVGLATLAPLAEASSTRGIALTAILSARRADLVMSEDLFRQAGARVHAVDDARGTSDVAALAAAVERWHADHPFDAVFTCGSARLVRWLQDFAGRHGLAGQVALEQQMACGLSMCFCCVRPFATEAGVVHRRVCWEGPVFDLQETLP